MERYYTEKREKAEEQERYIASLEAENKRLREENAKFRAEQVCHADQCKLEENKWLRELLQEAVAGHKSSWEWEDERMKWVEVQIDKETLMEIEQALEGGGE